MLTIATDKLMHISQNSVNLGCCCNIVKVVGIYCSNSSNVLLCQKGTSIVNKHVKFGC